MAMELNRVTDPAVTLLEEAINGLSKKLGNMVEEHADLTKEIAESEKLLQGLLEAVEVLKRRR